MPYLLKSPRGVLVAQPQPSILEPWREEYSITQCVAQMRAQDRSRRDAGRRLLNAFLIVTAAAYPAWLIAEALVRGW